MTDCAITSFPAFQRYQYEFTQYLRNPHAFRPPQGVATAAMSIYAGLLRNKIEDSLLSCFPITHALLGKPHWENLVEHFIAQHSCRSPFYRQIPDEFIDFLEHERADPSDPPFLNELAHFEWIELVLAIAQADEQPIENNDDLLKNGIVFTPVRTLLRYAYPVHRIGPELPDWPKWQAWQQESLHEQMQGETFIFGFRDRDDQVRFIEINALTARLIELLAGGVLSGKQALLLVATEIQSPDSDAMTAFGLDILDELRQQGGIVGTAPLLQVAQ
jgi:hypothetical protein